MNEDKNNMSEFEPKGVSPESHEKFVDVASVNPENIEDIAKSGKKIVYQENHFMPMSLEAAQKEMDEVESNNPEDALLVTKAYVITLKESAKPGLSPEQLETIRETESKLVKASERTENPLDKKFVNRFTKWREMEEFASDIKTSSKEKSNQNEIKFEALPFDDLDTKENILKPGFEEKKNTGIEKDEIPVSRDKKENAAEEKKLTYTEAILRQKEVFNKLQDPTTSDLDKITLAAEDVAIEERINELEKVASERGLYTEQDAQERLFQVELQDYLSDKLSFDEKKEFERRLKSWRVAKSTKMLDAFMGMKEHKLNVAKKNMLSMIANTGSGREGGSAGDYTRLLEGIERSSPERQLILIREVLGHVESREGQKIDQLNQVLKSKVEYVEELIRTEKLSPEVAAEASARLRLHEMTVILRTTVGKADDVKAGLLAGLSQVKASGRQLTGENFAVLFKGKLQTLPGKEMMNGINVGAAFKLLENAYIKGFDVNGVTLRLGQKGITQTQEDGIRRKLATELGENGAKALQLAERLADVTFESSVWKIDMTDLYSKAIYFDASRSSLTTEDAGPNDTILSLPTLGTSFLRLASYKDSNGKEHKILNDGEYQEVLRLMEMQDRDSAIPIYLKMNRLQLSKDYKSVDVGNSTFLDPREAEYEKLSLNAYGDYVTSYLPNTLILRELCLKSDIKCKEVTKENLEKWYASFVKSDPKDVLSMRYWFARGVLANGLDGIRREQLGWNNIRDVEGAVLSLFDTLMRAADGTNISFLTKNQVNYLKNDIKPFSTTAWNDFFDRLSGIAQVRR